MNKLSTILTTLLIAGATSSAFAAFPTNENTYTVDSSKVTGNFNSFSLKWVGANTQKATFGFRDGTTAIDLTGFNVGIKVSKKSATGTTAYISDASSGLTVTNITISTSNVIWTVNRTNIPPNSSYQVEIWTFDGATTNPTRTLAQGKLTTTDSLYDNDDSTYPWPVSMNGADFVQKIGDTMTGLLTLSGVPTDNLHAATKAYVDDAIVTNLIETITAGTSVTIVTNGTDRTISATGEANVIDEITAGDGINVTSNGTERTVAVDDTVIRSDGSVPMAADLDMNTNDLQNVQHVRFVPNGDAIEVYGIGFDETANTLATRIAIFTNSLLNIGEELWIQAKASDGNTYDDGTNVYFVSASGDKPTVGIMDGTDIDKLKLDAGAVTADAEGLDLLVAPFGVLNDQNTASIAAGTLVAIDSAGGFTTNTMGVVPHTAGIILRSHANAGKILRFPARILWNLDLVTGNGATTGNPIEVGGVTTPYVVFETNSITQFTGTLNTTNYVGWIDGTNTYRLLFDE